jgi:hypothetical protein
VAEGRGAVVTVRCRQTPLIATPPPRQHFSGASERDTTPWPWYLFYLRDDARGEAPHPTVQETRREEENYRANPLSKKTSVPRKDVGWWDCGTAFFSNFF